MDEKLVIKAGNIRSHEARILRKFAENTTILAPKVHDIRWKDWKDYQIESITMDHTSGKGLDDVWDTLNTNQKLFTTKELQPYINQLRDLKDVVKCELDGSYL